MTAKRFVAALAKLGYAPHDADKLPRYRLPVYVVGTGMYPPGSRT